MTSTTLLNGCLLGSDLPLSCLIKFNHNVKNVVHYLDDFFTVGQSGSNTIVHIWKHGSFKSKDIMILMQAAYWVAAHLSVNKRPLRTMEP